MKYLGIDYGTKKVGIATSDDSGSFAFPLSIVSTDKALAEIQKIAHVENIKIVILGESMAENGAPNPILEAIHKFAQKLETQGLNIIFIKESFSSVEAHRYQTKKGNRDDSAAAIILQRYLDKQKR